VIVGRWASNGRSLAKDWAQSIAFLVPLAYVSSAGHSLQTAFSDRPLASTPKIFDHVHISHYVPSVNCFTMSYPYLTLILFPEAGETAIDRYVTLVKMHGWTSPSVAA